MPNLKSSYSQHNFSNLKSNSEKFKQKFEHDRELLNVDEAGRKERIVTFKGDLQDKLCGSLPLEPKTRALRKGFQG